MATSKSEHEFENADYFVCPNIESIAMLNSACNGYVCDSFIIDSVVSEGPLPDDARLLIVGESSGNEFDPPMKMFNREGAENLYKIDFRQFAPNGMPFKRYMVQLKSEFKLPASKVYFHCVRKNDSEQDVKYSKTLHTLYKTEKAELEKQTITGLVFDFKSLRPDSRFTFDAGVLRLLDWDYYQILTYGKRTGECVYINLSYSNAEFFSKLGNVTITTKNVPEFYVATRHE